MSVKLTKKNVLMSCVAMGCVLVSSVALSEPVMIKEITKALAEGKSVLDVRLRAEMVSQDPKDDATAITARTRIGYQSGDFSGLKGYFEFENITAIVDDYNSTTNFKTEYPVVADPEGSEVNQAFVTYEGVSGLLVKLGRQRVILDNARFVGNVGWRQNEQTYDAALLNLSMIENLSASYAFVDEVNDIFGKSAETDTHLINVSYKGLPNAKITGYAYLLDMETGTDTQTLGLSVNGSFAINPSVKAKYAAEFAQMGDYADNDSGEDANYYLVELGGVFNKIAATLGYEVLGGDGTTSFQTPLATKHKFNGWADKFLGTPKDGLVDTYLTVTGKLQGIKLLATYHLFSSDEGGDDYGSEIDLLAVKKFGKHYTAGLKYANYMEGDYAKATDASKIWLWGGLKF